jgi:hypothetical protein
MAGAIVLLLAGARESEAFVPYLTSTGRTFSLAPCVPVPIVVYPGTFSQMTLEEVTNAATAATAAWSASENACTYLQFDVKVMTGPVPPVSNDHVHTIVLRDTSWCRLDAAGDCDPTDSSYDPLGLALTTISARTSTGEIVDADIEINTFHYLWADRVAHPELTDRYDLQNELTRQLGHLIGLDYACFNPAGGGTRPKDDAGNPVPDCASAPADIQAATMFPSNVVGDVQRRTLAPDDQAGVCGMYPAALNPCQGDGGPGCTCTSGDADGGQDAGNAVDAGASDAPSTDAPSADAPSTDAPSGDAGTMTSGGGCGCETCGGATEGWAVLALLIAAWIAAARRTTTHGRDVAIW